VHIVNPYSQQRLRFTPTRTPDAVIVNDALCLEALTFPCSERALAVRVEGITEERGLRSQRTPARHCVGKARTITKDSRVPRAGARRAKATSCSRQPRAWTRRSLQVDSLEAILHELYAESVAQHDGGGAIRVVELP